MPGWGGKAGEGLPGLWWVKVQRTGWVSGNPCSGPNPPKQGPDLRPLISSSETHNARGRPDPLTLRLQAVSLCFTYKKAEVRGREHQGLQRLLPLVRRGLWNYNPLNLPLLHERTTLTFLQVTPERL
jgi:hypothetical protein